jgi:Zn-dependent M28 family amino/carboxypeptidase
MIDISETEERLREHLRALTEAIGERSVARLEDLGKAAEYIESFYLEIGLPVRREPYPYGDGEVANLVAELSYNENPARRYLLGAHYDSVTGTVGADDNASAVAVQLETARLLKSMQNQEGLDVAVKFVSFALEEPPVFGTSRMGSHVHAKGAKQRNEAIDGMICLEMVGYTCDQPGCQDYPFSLTFLGYPKVGNFIGLVGNLKSRGFTNALLRAFRKNPDLPAVKLTVPFSGWLVPAVRLSDHSSFWDQGYRAVMVTDSAFYRNPHYHLSSDTMEKLDYRFMAELVESLIIFFRSHR